MANTWVESYVECPFFHRYEGHTIACTGCIPDSTATHYFKYKADAMQQMNKFCCDSYRTCEMYRAILQSREW